MDRLSGGKYSSEVMTSDTIMQMAASKLKCYIPAPMREQLEVGLKISEELKGATILFASILGLDRASDDYINVLQDAVVA